MLTQKNFTITQTELTAPARWRLTLTADACPPVVPGQFFLVQIDDPLASYLRRAVFPAPAGGTPPALHVEIPAVAATDPGIGWLVSRQAGTTVNLLGALGNGFSIPPSAQNILLVGDATQPHLLVTLANDAARRKKNVTLALHLPGKRHLPAHTLNPAVELLLVTEDGSIGHRGNFWQRLAPLIPWADWLGATGIRPFFHALKDAISQNLLMVVDGYAQILITGTPLHICGTGACGYCTVPTAHGIKLACADGPVFDLTAVRFDD